MRIRDKKIRISSEFDKLLEKIASEKINNGTAKVYDKKSFSKRRITLALSRHRDMEKMAEDVANADWEGDFPSI